MLFFFLYQTNFATRLHLCVHMLLFSIFCFANSSYYLSAALPTAGFAFFLTLPMLIFNYFVFCFLTWNSFYFNFKFTLFMVYIFYFCILESKHFCKFCISYAEILLAHLQVCFACNLYFSMCIFCNVLQSFIFLMHFLYITFRLALIVYFNPSFHKPYSNFYFLKYIYYMQ